MRIAHPIILFLALAIKITRADDTTLPPDFSKYPQTDAFKAFISNQTNAVGNLARTNLLTMVCFLGSDKVGLEYTVNENGQESDVRDVYNWAYQASHWKQLSDDQIKDLHSAIKALPTKNVLPPIRQLVVVSFKDSTNWITRSYDQTNLPTAMRKIYDIVGERFESQKPKTENGIF
jgi:hypothetical protein